MEINAHRMVANLAVEMAQTVYEGLAKDNTFYKTWTRTAFVKECAPTLRAEAKQLLAGMLTRNDVSQYEKDKIFEDFKQNNIN